LIFAPWAPDDAGEEAFVSPIPSAGTETPALARRDVASWLTYPCDAEGGVALYAGGGEGECVTGVAFRGGTRGGSCGLGLALAGAGAEAEAEEPEFGESRRRTGGGGRLFVESPVVLTRYGTGGAGGVCAASSSS
jgi:hypothetical protein